MTPQPSPLCIRHVSLTERVLPGQAGRFQPLFHLGQPTRQVGVLAADCNLPGKRDDEPKPVLTIRDLHPLDQPVPVKVGVFERPGDGTPDGSGLGPGMSLPRATHAYSGLDSATRDGRPGQPSRFTAQSLRHTDSYAKVVAAAATIAAPESPEDRAFRMESGVSR